MSEWPLHIWNHDGIPVPTAKKLQKFCKEIFAAFGVIKFWPSPSPDQPT